MNRSSFLVYYAATVFQKYLALPPLTAFALFGAVTTIITVAASITVPFIEKAGRRKWLIIGSCLQTLFLAIVTGLSPRPDYANSAAAAAFLFAFAAVLGATWDPFPVSSQSSTSLLHSLGSTGNNRSSQNADSQNFTSRLSMFPN